MKQSSKTRVAYGCSKGFTLIELMIVVSIIGILATMAVPIYRDRVIRAQVEEGLALAAMAQRAVEEFRDKTGFVPGDNKTAGLPAGEKIIGNYVTRVDVIGGAVNVHFGNRVHRDIKEKILTLRPAVVSDEKRVPIAWVCGFAQGVPGMDVIGVNQTNLLHQELPIDCRI